MSKSPNKTRQLTILRKHRPIEDGRRYTHDPDLRLCGKWLSETGFRSGQIVAVKCFDRKIVIEPIREPGELVKRPCTKPAYSEEHLAAQAQLLKKLREWGCIVGQHEPGKTEGECFTVMTSDGRWHIIQLRMLNLNKESSIKILESDFDHEAASNKWILLALYRRNRQPTCYLVPTLIFGNYNDTFILNSEVLPYHWEIRIKRRNPAVLTRLALDLVTKL